MHKNLLIAFTTILLIGFYACSHKTQTINPIVVTPVIPVDTTSNHTTDTIKEVLDTSVCFQRDILPIMQTACAKSGCHDAITKKSGYNLTSYPLIIAKGVVKGSANASKLFTACISFKMPPAPAPRLDSTQLTFLKRWINNGAHNDTNCAVNCDTTKYTYKAAIAPILNSYCNS